MNIRKKNKTLLVDGNALLKTAYFGAKNRMTNSGLYMFMTIIRKLILNNSFDKVVIFWDGQYSGKLKYELYPLYKANRNRNFINPTLDDREMWIQKERIKEYCEDLFIRQYQDDVVEADDCIGYYCANKLTNEVITICSNDRDFCQLLNDDVSIYLLDKKIILTNKNYNKYFNHYYKNARLVKIIEGCTSDNIFGILGVQETTLLDLFPNLKSKEMSLNELLIEAKQMVLTNKSSALQNIIEGKTKNSEFSGEQLYDILNKIINLSEPLITEEAKQVVLDLINLPLDPEGRHYKNVLKKMINDGFINQIPGGHDGYVDYIKPFIFLTKKEKIRYEKV